MISSGIGPREHLEDIGIPVVYDLPSVGSELVQPPTYADVSSLESPTNYGVI